MLGAVREGGWSGLREAVRSEASAAGFVLDDGQEAVLEQLVRLPLTAAGSARRHGGPRGLYLWGAPGRGKSWLLDAAFRTAPGPAKRRVHFHRFFDDLHQAMQRHRGEPDAAERALADLIGAAELLYFDEFHVHDPGDAVLLTRLLQHLLEHGVLLLISSNYPPTGLLPNPVFHHLFLPGIDLLAGSLDVVELTGTTDYRTTSSSAAVRQGFAAGAWLGPGTRIDDVLPSPAKPRPDSRLRVRDREFEVNAAHDGTLWITFAQLCDTPTSTIEYLDWAARFHTWVLLDVPPFTALNQAAQQRFVNALDVLADADVRLIVTSPLTRAAFSATAASRPDAGRTLSRLHLLSEPVR